MPKLRRRFSSVSAPFCWPMTATRWSPIVASPATTASSSPNARSPWSSMNSSAMTASSSSVRGRRRFRASWTRAQVSAFGSAGISTAASSAAWSVSRPRFRMRSTMGHPRRGEEPEQLRDLAPEVRPRDDPVDEPVPEQELGALEPRRQLLPDRAGADARAGEADEGIRLSEVDVAHRRIAREGAAGGGIGHDRDVRHAAFPQALERGHRLRELHQRERALLHPGAAARRHDHERDPLVEGRLRGSRDLLPDDRTHRAAHEREVHDDDGDELALDPARAPDGGVAEPGRELRGGHPVRVRLLIDEAERIDADEARVALLPGPLVEELAEAHRRRQPEVVAARRAHLHRLVELLVEQLLLARRAAGPHVLRGRGLPAGPEGRELHRHQAGPPRPPAIVPGTPAARRARAARAALAMARVERPGAGRDARHATYATPTMEIAAEVIAPPTMSGRRPPGTRMASVAPRTASSSAGSRVPARIACRRGSASSGDGRAPENETMPPRSVPPTASAGPACAAARSASRRASRSSNRNDGWTRTSAAFTTRAAYRRPGSSVTSAGASSAWRSPAASSASR